MLRLIRIAGLTASLIACSLTIIMWMRSYRQWDDVMLPNGRIGAHSVYGLLNIGVFSVDDPIELRFSTMAVKEAPASHVKALGIDAISFVRLPTFRRTNAFRSDLVLPYWLLLTLSGVTAAFLGLSRSTRFSLRQFAWATTAVTAVLAIGVAISRIG